MHNHNRRIARGIRGILLLGITLLLSSCRTSPTLHLGVTTTLEDSGLLRMLSNAFYQEHQIIIKAIVAGSGQLFHFIEKGDIDIAITHEPEGEKKLLQKGSIIARTPLFYSEFFIVGDQHDPAHVSKASTTQEAFTQLAKSHSVYISRNDKSGTHRMEQRWWPHDTPNMINILRTGTGMGETLNVAAQHNAYTLVDSGTWLNFNNKKNLKQLWRDTVNLKNHYHLLTLPKPLTSSKNNKHHATTLFSSWIKSTAAQSIISNYRIDGKRVFTMTETTNF
ncbi:substrate-binding domain-containing protein [Eionea flava]